jgi:hypothetical protein
MLELRFMNVRELAIPVSSLSPLKISFGVVFCFCAAACSGQVSSGDASVVPLSRDAAVFLEMDSGVSDSGDLESDAGPATDSGIDSDAGQQADAGFVEDSGVAVDAGFIDAGRPDAGTVAVTNRIIWFVTPHGRTSDWAVGMTSPPTPGPELAALMPFQASLTFIQGLDVLPVVRNQLGIQTMTHECPACVLGANAVSIPNTFLFAPTSTIDILVAKAQNKVKPVRDLHVSLGIESTSPDFGLEYARAIRSYDNGVAQRKEYNPDDVFFRIFAGASGCPLPTRAPRTNPPFGPGDFSNEYQYIVAAMSCGFVASATLSSTPQFSAPWLGFSNTLNFLAHDFPVASRANYVKIQQWQAAQVAQLATLLSSRGTPDGKTMLEHTLIVWIEDSGEERPHYHLPSDLRVVIVGSTPHFRSGQHLSVMKTHADLLRTLAEAVEVPVAELGPNFAGTTSIPALLK